MWKLIRTAILVAGVKKLWKHKIVRKYVKRYFLGGTLRYLPI